MIGLIVTLVLLIFVLTAVFLLWRHYRKKYQYKINQLKTELADATDEYEENLRKLQLLDTTHQKVIATIQQELTESQGEIAKINQEYELEKAKLLEDNKVLQKRIEKLQQEEPISKHLATATSFAKEPIVIRIRDISRKPLTSVTEDEWKELTNAFSMSYPYLYRDLTTLCNTPQSIRVCILTVMGIGNNEQANMLETTSPRVSNVKSALNKALFNETSSRNLHKNLTVKYNTISCY